LTLLGYINIAATPYDNTGGCAYAKAKIYLLVQVILNAVNTAINLVTLMTLVAAIRRRHRIVLPYVFSAFGIAISVVEFIIFIFQATIIWGGACDKTDKLYIATNIFLICFTIHLVISALVCPFFAVLVSFVGRISTLPERFSFGVWHYNNAFADTFGNSNYVQMGVNGAVPMPPQQQSYGVMPPQPPQQPYYTGYPQQQYPHMQYAPPQMNYGVAYPTNQGLAPPPQPNQYTQQLQQQVPFPQQGAYLAPPPPLGLPQPINPQLNQHQEQQQLQAPSLLLDIPASVVVVSAEHVESHHQTHSQSESLLK